MSPTTLTSLISKAFGAAGIQGVSFVFHGGEPLTCGRGLFESILRLQGQYRSANQGVRNTIQTNGLLLNEDWVQFFKDNDIHVGLSLDGPAELHNAQRPTVGGSGSFDRVMRALDLLQRHDVRFGLLVVVTKNTIACGPDRMFEFLMGLSVKSFAFLHERPPSHPLALYDPRTDYVGIEEFTPYIERIFDLWFERGDASIHIREFISIINACMGGKSSICTLAGHCIGKHFAVNVNGDVYHCDRYITDDGYLFGNVVHDDLDVIRENAKIAELRRRNEERLNNYSQCPYLPICAGGCPHDHYIDSRSIVRSMDHCCGQRDLIEHILHRIRTDLEQAKNRLGLPVFSV